MPSSRLPLLVLAACLMVLAQGAPGTASPLTTTGGDGWRQLSAGSFHTCGIRDDATLWCWGADHSGELGDGGKTPQPVPQQVGDRSDWVFVTGGHNMSCAIPADGTLWCWGRGSHGQLGDGSRKIVRTPVQVGQATNWVSVDASDGGRGYGWDAHACGVRTDGTVWCWGQNDVGQVGDGTTQDVLTPVQVGRGHHWAEVSAGNGQSCAVRTGGSLWCWGDLSLDGDTESSVPVRIRPGSEWTSVSVGGDHACAVRNDGTLWCGGHNESGQLGDGTRTNHLSLEQIGNSTEWSGVEAGMANTCALRTDGSAWCWGWGWRGQNGDGHSGRRVVPTRVVGGPAEWATVPSIRYQHACAVGADSTGWCWGANAYGQLGTGTKDQSDLPAQVLTS